LKTFEVQTFWNSNLNFVTSLVDRSRVGPLLHYWADDDAFCCHHHLASLTIFFDFVQSHLFRGLLVVGCGHLAESRLIHLQLGWLGQRSRLWL